MHQEVSNTDHRPPETKVNQLCLIIAPMILKDLAHLDLSAHFTFRETQVVSGGTYGDISKGYCKGYEVAVKRLRFFLREDIILLFEKEIYVWSKLKHDNILPLLGFAFDGVSGYPLLVSEWMANGSAWTYVNKHADCDLMRLVVGAARGLAYLHEQGVVHSDIKSDNILVSDKGDALLCDFGCSRMIAASRSLANLTSSPKGTLRYQSYELVEEPNESSKGHTLQSDVWAFGMTVFELLSHQRPYAHCSTDARVVLAIIRREIPRFPSPESINVPLDLFETLKNVCLSCWAIEPKTRPAIAGVLDNLLAEMNERMREREEELVRLEKELEQKEEGKKHLLKEEPVAPLEASASRCVAGSIYKRPVAAYPGSPEIVDRKVRSLLDKLTMEKFDSISNQIITWANKSESEKDGRTLIQVIRLVFERAINDAAWSEMYARLCRKMMEQISPNVQDDGIRNAEGKPITGGLLFRKYLLNRCKEDFERGWTQKESTAAAALVKATEDQAVKDANDKEENKEESALYSEEYYAAQKAKRQGLGLVKFIGELFKLQMLTERIMHECIKKLLTNVDNPEEEEIESLCKLLSTVGQALDTSKARGHMDIYFSRMKDLAKSNNISSRMQFMLQDVIELRERKWSTRNVIAASVFTIKGDGKRDSASLSRASSSTNMFQMLQAAEAANEAPSASSSRPTHSSSRTPSVDLTHNAPTEPAQRPRLNLLPRTKPVEKSEDSPADAPGDEEDEEGEIKEKDPGKSSMSKEQVETRVEQDRKEFFAIRDLNEAEEYFSALNSEHRHILVEKFGMSAIEAKEADAKLVGDLFERALSRNLCSPASFEEGLLPVAELLDDIVIDAPKAFDLFAIMTRVASKSMDSDKLLALLL